MAAHKKLNKRDVFIIFRVTKREKLLLEEDAMEYGRDFSAHMRLRLGLAAETE